VGLHKKVKICVSVEGSPLGVRRSFWRGRTNLEDSFHPYRNPEERGFPGIWRFCLVLLDLKLLQDVVVGFVGTNGADRWTGFLHGSLQ